MMPLYSLIECEDGIWLVCSCRRP